MEPLSLILLAALVVVGAVAVALAAARRPVPSASGAPAPAPAGPTPGAEVVDALPQPALLVDGAGRVVAANAPARRELPGAVPGAGPGALGDVLGPLVEASLRTGPVVRPEVTLGGQALRAFAVQVRPLPGGGVLVLLEDRTGDVDFREARRAFSAAVSHELRTPLARILGLSETLLLPQSAAEREALVGQVEAEVDTMRQLIDEMLLLAGLDRGRAATGEGTADVGAVARRTLQALRARRHARRRTIDLEADADVVAPVPARLLEAVVVNLVDNALLHGGPEARVAVAVRTVDAGLELVVADDGRGIDPVHLPHVFERFYRGDTSRTGPGSGLGLAVVKHIAEAYGGGVTIESRPAEGTRVRVWLPHAAPAEGGQPASARGSGSNR